MNGNFFTNIELGQFKKSIDVLWLLQNSGEKNALKVVV